MSAVTAIKVGRAGRLGLMVRTPTELYVYWRPAPGGPAGPLRLRISDLTGRPPAESLDGCGFREAEIADALFLTGLLPGHLYVAEVGTAGPDGFTPILSVGPVQTPWLAAADASGFPASYHRS
ncbi:MAG: hypothetical protein ACOY93_23625 [Bacillota bacterium]